MPVWFGGGVWGLLFGLMFGFNSCSVQVGCASLFSDMKILIVEDNAKLGK